MEITTTNKYIEVVFNFSDPHDRRRKDQLRAIGGFRYDKETRKWRAPQSPVRLLELADVFGNQPVMMDEDTKNLLAACKKADQRRLDKIDRLTKIKEAKEVDLEGYRFDYEPYQHQKEALTFLKHTTVCALFADCGVGKTFIMLHWLRYLKDHKEPRLKALVIAPLRTLYSAWGEDITKFTPELTYVVCNKTVQEAREVLAGKGDYDIYLMNPEKARILEKEIRTFNFDAVIVDESSRIKNAKAKTTKAILKIGDSGPTYRAVLSGTPAPNSPLEYWPQIRFLSQRLFGLNFYSFRDQYFVAQGFGGFSFAMNPHMEEKFTERLHAYALRYQADDCLDLPERTDQIIKVLLPPQVMELYEEYRKTAIATLDLPEDGQEVWASHHELDKFLKLRELANGYLLKREELIDDEGNKTKKETVRFIHEEKLLALKDLLEDLGDEQVLIWAQFTPEFKLLEKEISGAEIVNGSVSNAVAEDRIARFKSGELKYLIAHPRSIAHGLTFTNCRYIIWYSVDWSSEYDYQANKRIERAGQTRPTHHYYLLAHSYDGKETIDSSIYYALQGKYQTQLELLNSIIGNPEN